MLTKRQNGRGRLWLAAALAFGFSLNVFAADGPIETQLKLDLALNVQHATAKAINLGLACQVPIAKMQGFTDYQNASMLTVPSAYHPLLNRARNQGALDGKQAAAKLTPAQCKVAARRLYELDPGSAQEAKRIKADLAKQK